MKGIKIKKGRKLEYVAILPSFSARSTQGWGRWKEQKVEENSHSEMKSIIGKWLKAWPLPEFRILVLPLNNPVTFYKLFTLSGFGILICKCRESRLISL